MLVLIQSTNAVLNKFFSVLFVSNLVAKMLDKLIFITIKYPIPRSWIEEVEDRLIKRTVYTSKPPLKVEYALTDLGKTLIPIIQSIADWGDYVIENYSK